MFTYCFQTIILLIIFAIQYQICVKKFICCYIYTYFTSQDGLSDIKVRPAHMVQGRKGGNML
jgi:hypothetical protein